MTNNLVLRSKSVRAVKNLLKDYSYFEDRIEGLYREGFFYKRIEMFRDAFKQYIQESYLTKIIGEKEVSPLSISDSKIVGRLIRIVDVKKVRASAYFKHSKIDEFIHHVKTDSHRNSVKTISMIAVTALVTNMAILISLKIEISPLSWIMRITFMLLAAVILLSSIRWKDIKDNSILVRLFIKRQK